MTTSNSLIADIESAVYPLSFIESRINRSKGSIMPLELEIRVSDIKQDEQMNDFMTILIQVGNFFLVVHAMYSKVGLNFEVDQYQGFNESESLMMVNALRKVWMARNKPADMN